MCDAFSMKAKTFDPSLAIAPNWICLTPREDAQQERSSRLPIYVKTNF